MAAARVTQCGLEGGRRVGEAVGWGEWDRGAEGRGVGGAPSHVDVAVRGERRAKAKTVGDLGVERGLDGGVTLGAPTLVDAYCDDALEQVLVRICRGGATRA